MYIIMPRRQSYWKEYYAKNKQKYKKYYQPTYAYSISINGTHYVYDKKQDIEIKRIQYNDIKDKCNYVIVSSCNQK